MSGRNGWYITLQNVTAPVLFFCLQLSTDKMNASRDFNAFSNYLLNKYLKAQYFFKFNFKLCNSLFKFLQFHPLDMF